MQFFKDFLYTLSRLSIEVKISLNNPISDLNET